MRLQSLNCPNCGSTLKTENGMQICESCGSTFRIDYDDSDVAYERLSKEDELARQKFEHDKALLETEYRLKEEARIKQAKYEKSEARKKMAANKIRSLISLIVTLAVFLGIMYLAYRFIRRQMGINMDELTGITTTETTVSPYLLSASDLLNDSEFMENAIAAVLSDIRINRDGKAVTTYDLPVTDWYVIGEPEIYDCYLLVNEKENRLCFLVKITYQSERDEDDTKEIYDCLTFKNIKLGSDGKISCDYAVRVDRGDGATNWTWNGAEDSDQLYRSAILAKADFTREQVTLPESLLPSADLESDEEISEDYDEDEDSDDEDDDESDED